MAELYSNLAESATAGALNNTTDPVTFSITTGHGVKFPSAAVGSTDYFHAIVDSGTDVEILRCQRSGDSITADRAQEGTAKVAHVAGVKFAHVLTASALAQIPNYVQTSLATTKGDLITRTATGLTRQPAGSNGQVLVSDSTQTNGLRWGSGGAGGSASWQFPTFTIYYDGTTFFARMESDQTVPYTGSSLHTVHNAAATEMTTVGSETNLGANGGLIALSTPTNHFMPTFGPLTMANQETLLGPGRGCIVRAQTAGNWSAGTLAVPVPVIDAYLKGRVKVEGVAIDCNGFAGTTGILFEKGTGATGGNDAHSYFLFNEVRGFAVSGIQIGRSGSSGATSTAWLFGNQVVDDSGTTARGVCFFVGDCHYGWGNNIKVSTTNGYPMYVNADSVHIMGESHMVNNANCPNALITIVGGGHTRIEGIYFDNLRNFGAVAINPSGSGASNRTIIMNNWCHLQSQTNFPGTASVFKLNAVNGGCSGVVIAGNVGEADTEALRFTSIVDITNPASGAKIQNSLAMYGNSFQHVNGFITANNGTTSGAGSVAFGVNANMIESSNTGGGANGTALTYGP